MLACLIQDILVTDACIGQSFVQNYRIMPIYNRIVLTIYHKDGRTVFRDMFLNRHHIPFLAAVHAPLAQQAAAGTAVCILPVHGDHGVNGTHKIGP